MGTNHITITFNWTNYKKTVKAGKCNPPGVFAPFINVDPQKYNELYKKMKLRKLNLLVLQERFGEEMFNRVRGAAALTLRHARKFFPAYPFLVYEVLHGDWLAEVDGRGRHRDHVIHQPMSVYVGLSLLYGYDLSGSSPGNMTFGGQTLLDHCVEIMAKSPKCQYLRDYFAGMGGDPQVFSNDSPYYERYREDLFLDTFFLAALFHDIGYPWNFVTKVHDNLKTMSPIENPITQNSKWIARNYMDRLVLYPLKGYKGGDVTAPSSWWDNFFELVDKSIAGTHGFPGAIALLNLNDVIRRYPLDDRDNPARRFCLEWAAMAVMMHDMAGMYANIDKNGNFELKNPHLRLSLSRDPLSFMLTLTDKIQEFERPYAVFRAMDRKNGAAVTYDSACKEVAVSWGSVPGILNISYKYTTTVDYLKIIDKFRKEEKLYLDPEKGYLDFSGTPIRRVKLEAVQIP